MMNCREELYRNLNKFLNEDKQDHIIVAYTLTVVSKDAKTEDEGCNIIACAGGDSCMCALSVRSLMKKIRESLEKGAKK